MGIQMKESCYEICKGTLSHLVCSLFEPPDTIERSRAACKVVPIFFT